MSAARILIIEDNDSLRTILRTALSKAGYEVTEAGDGTSGLASYRQDPFDVVVTDILMEGIEGLETIRELRRDYPQVKIIAMSGADTYMADKNLESSVINGADLTLTKPFRMQSMLRAITTLLSPAQP